jgi:type IV pilus assembly protein PilX
MNRTNTPDSRRREGGFVLVTGMLILIVVTLLSVSIFRSLGLQERIAGNTREKQRALEAAQSALQYGEWWINLGNAGTGVDCTSVGNANNKDEMKVCNTPLAAPAALPWTARADYLPAEMTVKSGGGLAASGDINYWAKPGLHIHYLGLGPDLKSLLYQVSAFGYGGSETAAAVVQSVYQIKPGNEALDRP